MNVLSSINVIGYKIQWNIKETPISVTIFKNGIN